MGVCARATPAPPQRRAHQRARRARSPPLPLLSPPPVYHHHLNIPQLRALCLPLRFPFARLLLSQKVSLAGSTPARARGRPAHLTNCTTTITGGSGSRPYPSTTPMHAHTHTHYHTLPATHVRARRARPPGGEAATASKPWGVCFQVCGPTTLLYSTILHLSIVDSAREGRPPLGPRLSALYLGTCAVLSIRPPLFRLVFLMRVNKQNGHNRGLSLVLRFVLHPLTQSKRAPNPTDHSLASGRVCALSTAPRAYTFHPTTSHTPTLDDDLPRSLSDLPHPPTLYRTTTSSAFLF